MMLRISWVDLKEPGVSQERPGRSRSSQEEPRDAQKQLRSDQYEFHKNRKNEVQNAFGRFRETQLESWWLDVNLASHQRDFLV